MCGAAKGRIHITPAGVVTIQPFGLPDTATCFTSLEGASFALSATGFTALTLENGWTHAPFSTRNAAVSVSGGIVRFQGAIATAGTTTTFATLPAAFRPATSVWLPVTMCDSANGRIHIGSNGSASVQAEVDAASATCFTSLEGVTFGQ